MLAQRYLKTLHSMGRFNIYANLVIGLILFSMFFGIYEGVRDKIPEYSTLPVVEIKDSPPLRALLTTDSRIYAIKLNEKPTKVRAINWDDVVAMRKPLPEERKSEELSVNQVQWEIQSKDISISPFLPQAH